ncbi:hypothetical protein [Thalassobacillus hwangdonensis]|uniref:Uncharacterized protein n=1 Tax=Thalassobacillus hwangdonensis TaxID=546108 RepID=A0ABW3L4N0_9BACI
MKTCENCSRGLSDRNKVTFDDFGALNEVKHYCKSCYIKRLVNNFSELQDGNCENCGGKLVVDLDDLDIDLMEERIIWFRCENYFKDDSDHEDIGLYVIQP